MAGWGVFKLAVVSIATVVSTLLTLRSESLRIHTIKQQVMKYYFDKEPYKTIN